MEKCRGTDLEPRPLDLFVERLPTGGPCCARCWRVKVESVTDREIREKLRRSRNNSVVRQCLNERLAIDFDHGRISCLRTNRACTSPRGHFQPSDPSGNSHKSMSFTIEQIGQPTEPLVRVLIAQSEGLPDDFKVLKKELRASDRGDAGARALCRFDCALEHIVHDVYKRRFRVPSDKLRLAEMIERLNKKKQLPHGIFRKADYIRSVGNVGAHSDDEGSSALGRVDLDGGAAFGDRAIG